MSRYSLGWMLLGVMFLMLLLPGVSLAASPSWNQVVDEIDTTLNEALKVYEQGKVQDAQKLVQDAYYGSYEARQMEKEVKFNISAKRNAQIEEEFRQVRKLMAAGAPQAEVKQRAVGLVSILWFTIIHLKISRRQIV